MKTQTLIAAVLGAGITAIPALAENQQHPTSTVRSIPIDVEAAIAGARFEGMGDQRELIVPLPLDERGHALGATGRMLIVKGVCGPNGAVSTPEQLLELAHRSLTNLNNRNRGTATAIYGESPRFIVSYDPNDVSISLFLLNMQVAAEYIDSRLDDRVDILIDFSTADLPGNAIGGASSFAYIFSYESYRKGLRAADNRVPNVPNFADALPVGSFPVWYDNTSTTTNETSIIANMSQTRAIFGDPVIAQSTAVDLQLDNQSNWDFFVYQDDQVNSGTISVVDVMVHELTHGLGFRSMLREFGDNAGNQMAGLDLARFRGPPVTPGAVGGIPLNVSQFASFPRWGDNPVGLHDTFYAHPNNVNAIELIELEGGDFVAPNALQPSHLAYRSDFASKLGIMDPVISDGSTYGPEYWGSNEFRPINDMGWKIIVPNDVAGDCNGNGVPDVLDIANGFRDADKDSRLDVCETFINSINISGGLPNGITETIYDANGITSLSQFSKGSATELDRFLQSGFDQNYIEPDRVHVLSGFMFAPQPDEYAFRIGHLDGAELSIAGITRARHDPSALTGSLDNAALPIFVQLEAGWHEIELTVLINGVSQIRLSREAGSLGGWGPIPSNELQGFPFPDCNQNNIDDQFEPDADGDGVPDDCELDCDGDGVIDDNELDCDNNGVPDDCEPRADFLGAFDVGVVGTADDLIQYGTCNSPAGLRFDTEIAIWNAAGDLIDTNDDTSLPCSTNRLSRLDLQLPIGEYFLAVSGYNMAFSDSFGVQHLGSTCSEGGQVEVEFGSMSSTTATVQPGKATIFKFEIVETPPCAADLAAPFGVLNFFDISTFISLYNSNDPAADFAAPFGTLNFFDISAFIAEYNMGCP